MTPLQKRALGAVLSALSTLISALLSAYLKAPAEVQISIYGLIAAVAAFWQIDVSPPDSPGDSGER